MKEIIIRMLDRLDDRELDLVFFFLRGLTK